jgi:hypothetical protein
MRRLSINAQGSSLEFRPLDQLKPLLESVDVASARQEMERWKKEAVFIVEPTDKELFESCKMYVLLRSIIEKEGLSGISMDCLNLKICVGTVRAGQNSKSKKSMFSFRRLWEFITSWLPGFI